MSCRAVPLRAKSSPSESNTIAHLIRVIAETHETLTHVHLIATFLINTDLHQGQWLRNSPSLSINERTIDDLMHLATTTCHLQLCPSTTSLSIPTTSANAFRTHAPIRGAVRSNLIAPLDMSVTKLSYAFPKCTRAGRVTYVLSAWLSPLLPNCSQIYEYAVWMSW